MNSLDDNVPGFGNAKTGAPGEKVEPSPEQLERDIDGIRENLGELISELDQRRRRLNPMNIVRSNPVAIAVGGALVIGLCVGGIAWRVSRARKAARVRHAGGNLSLAMRARFRKLLLGDVVEGPLPIPAGRPHVTMKILTAAGTALATVAARRLAEGAFARARARTPRRGP